MLSDELLRPIYVEAFNKAMHDKNSVSDAGLIGLRAVAEAAVKDAVGGEPVAYAVKHPSGYKSAVWVDDAETLELAKATPYELSPLYERPQASAAVPEGFYAGLARVAQKLTAAQDCHPNAVQALISEAIQQLESVSESALDARRKMLAASRPEVRNVE